jgi:hypothetical protein
MKPNKNKHRPQRAPSSPNAPPPRDEAQAFDAVLEKSSEEASEETSETAQPVGDPVADRGAPQQEDPIEPQRRGGS